jgi:hypothetical protein
MTRDFGSLRVNDRCSADAARFWWRAYYGAAEEFLAWCGSASVPSIAAVHPAHVAAWIEASTRELAVPSVKQRLALQTHHLAIARRSRHACIRPSCAEITG